MLGESETKLLKNIEHVLLAEFDIDKGSVIKFIHPKGTFDEK
jgi:hypothetical protein